MTLIAIFLPWLSFFLRGKIISGIICAVLQVTLIGWIPAAIWAVSSLNNARQAKQIKKMEKRIIASQMTNNDN